MKNTIVLPINFIESLLENVRNLNSYYVGGTLCIDHNGRTYLFNLNETVNDTSSGITYLLSIKSIKLLFNLYLEVKGETEYYKEKINNSCMKYLVD